MAVLYCADPGRCWFAHMFSRGKRGAKPKVEALLEEVAVPGILPPGPMGARYGTNCEICLLCSGGVVGISRVEGIRDAVLTLTRGRDRVSGLAVKSSCFGGIALLVLNDFPQITAGSAYAITTGLTE